MEALHLANEKRRLLYSVVKDLTYICEEYRPMSVQAVMNQSFSHILYFLVCQGIIAFHYAPLVRQKDFYGSIIR